LPVHAFPRFADWDAIRRGWHAREVASVDRLATAAAPLPGTCPACGASTGFAPPVRRDDGVVDCREGLACLSCHVNARQRAAVVALEDALGPAPANVYLTEQASWLYMALRRRCPGLVGSEYGIDLHRRFWLTLWLWRAGTRVMLRGEDVTRLRFRDGQLRGVLSLDVLEHVPDHRRALREFRRVLGPGGACVMTVPFRHDREDNLLRARIDADGAVEHLLPPEYHGDPMGGGILAYHGFGWALLEDMREAGFRDVAALNVDGAGAGLPQGVWVLRGRVPAGEAA
jgi:SAM-dependent methyltransferase